MQNSDGTDLFDITDNGEVEVKSGDFRIPSYKSIYGGGSSTYAITLEGTAGMNFKSWAKDFSILKNILEENLLSLPNTIHLSLLF